MALTYVNSPQTYNFSLDPCICVIQSGKMSGTEGNYTPDEDNLFCLIGIYQMVDDDFENAILLAQKAVPYSRLTGQASVDIHGCFNLAPTLPVMGDASGQATDTMMRGAISVADQYGIPGYHESNLILYNFYFIYGSSRTIIQTLPPTAGFDLHSYVDLSGDAISKRVSKSQPDWIYFVQFNESNTVNIKADLLYDDGTSETVDIDDAVFAGTGVFWVAAGYTQLGIESLADPDKTVVAYTVKLKNETALGNFASISYTLVAETDWEVYLVMDNGLGGVESVLMQGKPVNHAAAERQTATLNWDKSNYARGQKLQYNNKGTEQMELSTGWTDNEDYIYHLRQLLVGQLWIIDPLLGFVKVLCTDSQIKEIRKADQVLFSLDLNIEMAFSEDSFNNFYRKWIA